MPQRSPLHGFNLLLGLVSLISLVTAPSAVAQLIDAFDDGNFHSDPSWTGTADRWQIGELNGAALQSNGAAAADTIYLSVPSSAAFGTWQFTFAHRSVNLSSYNGARIFLISDRADPRRSAAGYYLQLGTNNSDMLSLWRADGSLATQRVELARSAEDLAAGDSNQFNIVVERDIFGRFRVFANGALALSATDLRHSSSSHFAIWIKHSAKGGQSFFLDDVAVTPEEADDFEGPVPVFGDIVINEVLFDPAAGVSEFIELQNRGQSSFDLRGLRFRDARSDQIPISYTPYLLEPGEYAVLVEDVSSFSSDAGDLPLLPIDGWPPLNNGGDTIILTGPAGIVDSLSYNGTGSVRGVSLERIDPDGPTEPYNFAGSLDRSGSTPGRINSVFAIDDAAPLVRFVEQTGPTTLELHFNEPVRTEELSPSSVVYGAPVLELLPLSATAVRISVDGRPTDPLVGIENIRDRKGNRSERLTHPVAFLPEPGDLAITEIMYEPLADKYDGRADQVEFIELFNAGDRRLTVAEFIRTRQVDERGDADTLRFGRAFASLVPGAYMVVSVHDSTAVRAAFPSSLPDAATVYVVARGLNLPNGGDLLNIHNRLGEKLERVPYGPSWHHPDVAATRGFSLERIDVGAPAAEAANWSSSVAGDGATPGAANSVAFMPRHGTTAFGITVDPSPFSPDGDGRDDVAVISYQLQASTPNIRIRIYNLDGVEVRTLVPAAVVSSAGRLVWDGRDGAERTLRVGVYIIVFEAVDSETRRVEQYKRPVVLARPFR